VAQAEETVAAAVAGAAAPGEDSREDFGFGARVAQQSQRRLLNRDGSFNVVREGLPYFRSLSPYHALLTLSWPRFFALVASGYFAANLLFAVLYFACGPYALDGWHTSQPFERFEDAFFFSVQTLATIGYGRMTPNGVAVNLLVTVEALVGLMGFALATGLLFARFSRPSARLVFSRNAVVGPFRGGRALMFRLANERSSQLTEVSAIVSLSRLEDSPAGPVRRFHELRLDRPKVVFLPLHWVVVHPIDERSPLWGVEEAAFCSSQAEILILLAGMDETFSQAVHARTSYRSEEVVWNARFADMFLRTDEGLVGVDMRRIHEIEPA
jgi:inward rectifier potassium channel